MPGTPLKYLIIRKPPEEGQDLWTRTYVGVSFYHWLRNKYSITENLRGIGADFELPNGVRVMRQMVSDEEASMPQYGGLGMLPYAMSVIFHPLNTVGFVDVREASTDAELLIRAIPRRIVIGVDLDEARYNLPKHPQFYNYERDIFTKEVFPEIEKILDYAAEGNFDTLFTMRRYVYRAHEINLPIRLGLPEVAPESGVRPRRGLTTEIILQDAIVNPPIIVERSPYEVSSIDLGHPEPPNPHEDR